MYVCVCVCVCMCVCMHIRIYVRIYYVLISPPIFLRCYFFTSREIHTYVCMYVCMYVCNIRTYIHIGDTGSAFGANMRALLYAMAHALEGTNSENSEFL
jgi:hypothetical protein